MIEKLPSSIQAINNLPQDQKWRIYKQLIANWVFDRFDIDPVTLLKDGEEVVKVRCPDASRAMELEIRHLPNAHDPVVYLNMVDTFTNQLMVLLVVINDPQAPRFNVDIDQYGNNTNFGTSSRNIPEELRAMQAGLAPGQIKRGLRSFKASVPVFEDFVSRMGHDIFFIEPLSYHNAIVFERYGFAYMYGKRDMEWINQAFQPDGELHKKLDDSNPFRHSSFWNRIAGRSWAIHDGILGYPFTGFQMYKRLGQHAGIQTFPHARW